MIPDAADLHVHFPIIPNRTAASVLQQLPNIRSVSGRGIGTCDGLDQSATKDRVVIQRLGVSSCNEAPQAPEAAPTCLLLFFATFGITHTPVNHTPCH